MDLLDTVQRYWFLILFVGGVIAAAVRTEMKVKELGSSQKDNSDRLDMLEKSLDTFREDIKVDIREIKTTQQFILEAIKEIKAK
jgi:hypothetical protein